MDENSGRSPVLQARISFEYKKKFDEVLARLIARRGKTLPSDLVRVILGDEKSFGITDKERAYLKHGPSATGSSVRDGFSCGVCVRTLPL